MGKFQVHPPVRTTVLVVVLALGGLLVAEHASARVIDVTPKSTHSALTQTTDESFGYQVLSGKPMKVDLVGPGNLTITVRLNNKSKRPVFKGLFTIRRNKKVIKRAKLKLFRSRVGAYREDDSIHPSISKLFRTRVPKGLQGYIFSLRASRNTSMTVHLKFETEADQSQAKSEEDALALVSLVPPDVDKKEDNGEVPLVPLTQPKEKKPVEKAKPATVTVMKKPIELPRPPPVTRKKPEVKAVAVKTEPRKRPLFERIKPIKLPKTKKTTASRTIKLPASQENPTVEAKTPERSSNTISLGFKGGMAGPISFDKSQWVGGTTYALGLDIRYILPVFDERLTLGVEAGYYKLNLDWKDRDRTFNTMVIPILLQLYYRLPIESWFQLFGGAGGGVYMFKVEDSDQSESAETNINVGGHLIAGVESEIGPGYLFLEGRAGWTFGATPLGNNVNVAGLVVVLGYRFVI